MKVTVCFGSIRIVVPVGDGHITVAQLTEKSLGRFRKVAKKDPNEKITVHHLHSIADDGILDLDDVLSDVVDDRDVLVAVFEEETESLAPPLPDTLHLQALHNSQGLETWSGTEKESSLVSEHSSNTSIEKHKRNNDSDYYSSNQSQESNQVDRVDKWVQETARSSPTLSCIKEPKRSLTVPNNDVPRHRSSDVQRGIDVPPTDAPERGIDVAEREIGQGTERGIDDPTPERSKEEQEETALNIEIVKDKLPLGLNVQYIDTGENVTSGLYVTDIEEGGVADGRLHQGDKIQNINGVNLVSIPANSVVDVFNEMSSVTCVRLSVVRSPGVLDALLNAEQDSAAPLNESSPDNVEEFAKNSNKNVIEIKLNKGQKGLGFTIATRDYSSAAGGSPIFVKTVHRHGAAAEDGTMQPDDILLKVNGISLQGKSQQEVVSMMRKLEGTVVLTIKRARGSDKSGIEVEGTQKKTPPKAPSSPRTPPPPKPPSSPRTQLTLEIPLITPEGKLIGLGISVKGKSMYVKNGEPRQGYGIFIKTILKGGAAELDGRLKPDDQLIAASGVSLLGHSNKDAMQILKQSLERSTQCSHVLLVVARKDVLNLSAESRSSKHYSSFKDPRDEVRNYDSTLATNPSKYRAMSLSSPNLGRKKRNNVEMDGGRGVAFSENVQKITTAGDVLESDDDVVFVGDLPEQKQDPFDRDSIFRKSMKKIDHKPIDPSRVTMKRASSQEYIAQYPEKPTHSSILKRGMSSESIFSGKDMDPIYDSIDMFTNREPVKTNDSFQAAIGNGLSVPSNTNANTAPIPHPRDHHSDDSKSKSKSFLNFFSKKGNKKRDDSNSSDISGSLQPPSSRCKTGSPRTSTPKSNWHTNDPHTRRSDRSNQSKDSRNVTTRHATSRDRSHDRSRDRPHDSRYDNSRDHPRAPGGRTSPENNHRRSKSSDFYRDRELAERSGLGFIEHNNKHQNRPRDPSHEYDRHSNHSNHGSSRSKDGDRTSSRAARESGAYKPYSSSHQLRDDRYLDPTSHSVFRYGRGSSPAPKYPDNRSYYPPNPNSRYQPGHDKQYHRPSAGVGPDDRYRHHNSYTPMISTPISQFQEQRTRHSSADASTTRHHTYDNLPVPIQNYFDEKRLSLTDEIQALTNSGIKKNKILHYPGTHQSLSLTNSYSELNRPKSLDRTSRRNRSLPKFGSNIFRQDIKLPFLQVHSTNTDNKRSFANQMDTDSCIPMWSKCDSGNRKFSDISEDSSFTDYGIYDPKYKFRSTCSTSIMPEYLNTSMSSSADNVRNKSHTNMVSEPNPFGDHQPHDHGKPPYFEY